MKRQTVQCMACSHLRVERGTPVCGHCERPVTPGNMTSSRRYHSELGTCQMAATLRVATGRELLEFESILHGYV